MSRKLLGHYAAHGVGGGGGGERGGWSAESYRVV